ncbi:N-acetylmuramic acid 6-phosphate etherase [Faecalicatena contorta]|uniref:N-acetylmuramic acid 6-phosphate etherase n=1 Tax=Faecalicatena contorta TaxID=39482 RepID=A0A316A290_9FIRM|nr:N-acetylmuramic acid 6-phosphate etherase [Faecalicatena contorta]PWJ51689.1 N-acetylmuramic acid 6-phosphate etherase [Faecalicatena contorta]SUQ13245.1 N-acetylmuramic acid 6-phosphate etherase [Faecalicatena contorta]
MEKEQLHRLSTEISNPKSKEMDIMEIHELLVLMNQEDENVIKTVRKAIPTIEQAVKQVIYALENGGRLIYVGAGTSGRIGVMDAVECIPTFSTTDEVIAIMAGGEKAFARANEGAEDSEELAAKDLENVRLKKEDVVLAIAASGRTPYCIGALKAAKEKGAACISLACNYHAAISDYADIAIEVDAGPEVLTGSTRLKAGTCQKLVLNMISTTAMVGIGKVYGNHMVDMKATNHKLEDRAKRIIMESTQCSENQAVLALQQADQSIKTAIVMLLTGASREEAEQKLCKAKGFVKKCI